MPNYCIYLRKSRKDTEAVINNRLGARFLYGYIYFSTLTSYSLIHASSWIRYANTCGAVIS